LSFSPDTQAKKLTGEAKYEAMRIQYDSLKALVEVPKPAVASVSVAPVSAVSVPALVVVSTPASAVT
jgi:hypothetical protein